MKKMLKFKINNLNKRLLESEVDSNISFINNLVADYVINQTEYITERQETSDLSVLIDEENLNLFDSICRTKNTTKSMELNRLLEIYFQRNSDIYIQRRILEESYNEDVSYMEDYEVSSLFNRDDEDNLYFINEFDKIKQGAI